MTPILSPLKSLLYSRKVQLAAAGVIQTVVLHYALLPVEVWTSINVLILACIAGIAIEDAAEKKNVRVDATIREE